MRTRFLIAAAALGLTGPLVAAGSGSLTATPNPCAAVDGTTPCSTLITVDSADLAQAQVWVAMDGGAEKLFSCGTSGTQAAAFIVAGHPYTFTLYESADCSSDTKGSPITSLVVRGTIAPPTLTAPAANAVFTGTLGQFMSVTISATGWPITYNVTGLPPGLSFVNVLGNGIQGTPTATGSYTATLSASDSGGTTSENLFFAIGLPPKPVITSGAFPAAALGSAFSYPITAANNPASFSAAGLPDGLTLNAATGLISGTPAGYGSFSVTLSAVNAGGAGSTTLPLTVQNAPPVITSPVNASGIAGKFFSFQITATHQPLSFSASGLPSGLFLDAQSGILSGTVSAVSVWDLPITVANSAATVTRDLILSIFPPAPVITGPFAAAGQVGVPFSVQMQATDAGSFTASGLPPGLAITTAGLIKGTPTTAQTYKATVKSTTNSGTGAAVLTVVISTPSVSTLPAVATPVLSPGAGVYAGALSVAMSCATPDAQIRYTVDNSAPGATSTLYAGTALRFTASTTLRVKAFKAGLQDSAEATATYTINALPPGSQPPSINQAPVDQRVLVGQAATFTVVASGTPPLVYQWYKNNSAIAGATGASYTTPAATPADNQAQFSVSVTNLSTVQVVGGPAVLTVSALSDQSPVITSVTANPNPVTGTLTTLLVTAQDAGGAANLAYQWTSTPADPARFKASNVTAPTAFFTQPGTYVFRVTVQNAQGLTTAGSVSVNVNPTLTAVFVNPPLVLKVTGTPYTFTATAVDQWGQAISPPPAFTWNAPGASLVNGVFTATNAGAYTVSASAGGIAGYATVTVAQASTRPAVLSVGSATGAAGTTVTVPVSLTPSPDAGVSGLEFNAALPAGITLTQVTAGSVVSSTGKSLLTGPNHSPILIFGGTGTIGAGVVANLQLQIAPGTPAGSWPVTLTNLSGTDPASVQVPLTAVPGSVTVANPASPAATTVLAATDFSSVNVYPNPWRADRPKDGVHFENLPAGSTVKIFTLSAHWVQTLAAANGQAIWNLKNASGDTVASGLYVYLVTDPQGGKIKGKLAIIR